ncbi:MAG TPA: HAMP domain-containing sensor histidine kinase [Chroococcales cyanobacterium]
MLDSLRRKLAISFVLISLVIYCFSAVLATGIFAASMNADLDNNLNRILEDIQPSVQVVNGSLSLEEWAENAKKQHLNILHSVQLYDKSGNFLEEHGRPGVRKLQDGMSEGMGLRYVHRFRSRYTPVLNDGYLQVQMETNQSDDSVKRFIVTMLLITPILAIATGICGYIFAGRAVAPVGKSLVVLRQFVADAGHELNTPTAIIEASVQTLEDSMTENGINTDVVGVIGRASKRLRVLAANLVLLARMESPELQLPMSRMLLDEFVEQLCEDFVEIARNKGVTLRSKAESVSIVSGHPDSLHHMLSNLIDNSIRYTEPGGTVTVSATRQENIATISVADTGIGIPDASLDRIFDRFYRVDKSRARSQGGTGLGLSIVKAVVEAHHFSIRVESQDKRGTQFIVTMPCQPEPRRSDRRAIYGTGGAPVSEPSTAVEESTTETAS